MTRTLSQLDLAPSVLHQRLMDELSPELAYDGGDVAAWQKRLRRKVRQLLGYQHMPRTRSPLNVRTLWRREHPLGTIEKIAFTSEPGSDVVAYLCLPANAAPPYPTFICLQGHSTGMHNSIGVAKDDESQTIDVEGDRDYGLACMKRGVAALCIEQRSFGERGETVQQRRAQHQCHDAVMHALMLGRTLAGERVYDVQRAIELLKQRDDIDMTRLGLLGNSGGGTITLYACALLPEIQLAMPSCSFCTYRDSIMSIYHCADNYIPNMLRYAEMADVMGLFAPKPVVIVTGKEDPIFPLKAVRRAFKDLKAIYKAAGAEENCQLVVGDGGHRFYADAGWKKMLPMVKR